MVFTAFITTTFTSISTQSAQLRGIGAVLSQGLSSKGTNIRTLSVETDAILHHINGFFLQTRFVAVIASLHTT
ncbi:hypothetical protein AWJ19_17840 [Paenibacillus sp. DMB5]|nr:hypothetical protein AWJ19_17840 [Paenibacillus sp. DMB5]